MIKQQQYTIVAATMQLESIILSQLMSMKAAVT